MNLLKGSSPSSETLLPVDAREKTASGIQSTSGNRQRPNPPKKMAYLRRTIMALLLCMLVFMGLASAGAPRMPCHNGATDQQAAAATSESFSEMLKSASPASLHELLHRYFPGRSQDGVFESEHKAMEAVHRANAALATSIVQLAKRDETNSTTTSGTSAPPATQTTTSDPPVDSSTSTSALPPSSSSSSSSSSSVPPPSSSSVPPASTSSSPSPSSTSTPRPSSSPPGTSSNPSETTLSPSSSGPRTTPSSRPQTLPSSSIPGDTTLTTSTIPPATTTPPPQTSKPVVTTFTSTSPNGVVVTVIATTYVPGDAGAGAAPTSTRTPSLQNTAVARRSGGSILAGVVALAMLFIVV